MSPSCASPGRKIRWHPLYKDSRRVDDELRGGVANNAEAGSNASLEPNVDYDEAWHVAGVCLGAINTLFQSSINRWARHLVSPVLLRVGPRDPLQRGLFTGMALNPTGFVPRCRRECGSSIGDIPRSWDAWICPVFPTPESTHRRSNAPIDVNGESMPQLEANLLHSILFNLTGHPVVTIPIGLSSGGLPIGVQVVGQRSHEMAILEVAGQVSWVAQAYRSPSGY